MPEFSSRALRALSAACWDQKAMESSLVVAERADEVLISDKLAGRLGVVALDFKRWPCS